MPRIGKTLYDPSSFGLSRHPTVFNASLGQSEYRVSDPFFCLDTGPDPVFKLFWNLDPFNTCIPYPDPDPRHKSVQKALKITINSYTLFPMIIFLAGGKVKLTVLISMENRGEKYYCKYDFSSRKYLILPEKTK